MNQKVRDCLENYVDGMENLGEKLDTLPISPKTGGKIGVAAAFAAAANPVTAAISAGATLGIGALYGGYKIAKHVLKKE